MTWEEALTFAADGLRRVRRTHGREAIAVYQGNPTAHNLGLTTVDAISAATTPGCTTASVS